MRKITHQIAAPPAVVEPVNKKHLKDDVASMGEWTVIRDRDC